MKKSLRTVFISAICFASLPVMANNMDMSTKLQKMDTNKDGMISADEHAAYAKMQFDKADINHNGSLSKEECADMMKVKKSEMKKNM